MGKTENTKTGRDYLDELDFWADKELSARLALQKAEAELTEYVRALEANPKDVTP